MVPEMSDFPPMLALVAGIGAIAGVGGVPGVVVVMTLTMITTSWRLRLAHAMDGKPRDRARAVRKLVMAFNMIRKAVQG